MKLRRLFLPALALSVLVAKAAGQLRPAYESPVIYAEADTGMVVATDFPFAAKVGLETLRQGGSAVDAALTTAITQIVLRAGMAVSFAGVVNLVHYEATTGQVTSMDACFNVPKEETDPWSIPTDRPNGRTALVPGFMAGVQAAHDRFGRLPFAALFEPGIHLAENGVPLHPYVGQAIQHSQAVLGRLPETRCIFSSSKGEFYRPGELFRQPELAKTLQAVAELGAEYMYGGTWAQHFVEAVGREGGVITEADLGAYEVIWSEPARTTYGKYEICGPGLPAHGGVNLVEAFSLLELSDLPAMEDYRESPEALFWLMQMSRGNVLSWFSPEELDALAPPDLDLTLKSRLEKETAVWLWQQILEGNLEFMAKPAGSAVEHSDAIVAVDRWGNIAALAHSINTVDWGQTGIFVDGVSIPDAAVHQLSTVALAGPGGRMPQKMNPAVVLRNDKPVIACSSVGVGMHVEAFQRLADILAYGLSLKETLARPSFLYPEWTPAGIVARVRAGDFDAAVLKELRAMGQPVKEVALEKQWDGRGYWVGIVLDADSGRLQGGAPEFVQGAAEGY